MSDLYAYDLLLLFAVTLSTMPVSRVCCWSRTIMIIMFGKGNYWFNCVVVPVLMSVIKFIVMYEQ